jgi:hypothetical protein
VNAAARRIEAAEGALAGRRVLYCVGAQRAGTSWLDAMFRRHPELHTPILKEVHYWDTVRPPHARSYRRKAAPDLEWFRRASRLARVRRYHLRALVSGRAVERLLEARVALYGAGSPDHAAYAALLLDGSRAGQVLVDNTPGYSLLGSGTFAEMAALGDARFVFVMRDPVARLWSGIKHRMRHRIDEGTVAPSEVAARFAAAVEAPDDPDVARSDYVRTIAALEAAVPEGRRLYLFHETLFSQAAYDRVTDFVGIARGRARPGREVNRSRTVDARPDPAVVRRARERLAPVYDFVRERFGPDVPATWMQ